MSNPAPHETQPLSDVIEQTAAELFDAETLGEETAAKCRLAYREGAHGAKQKREHHQQTTDQR